ncbi:MAG TPA: ChaN family lipoprotein [Thermoanaerobaculia bacterium]|nr:ChaN family lipoprotein [Thermoanaerobaculia bacterium]
MTRAPLLRVLPLLLLAAAPLAAQDRTLHLAIGDPARREREAPLVLDAITDTRTGEVIAPDDLAARLAGSQLVIVGEEHTGLESHRAQLRVIQELHRAGRTVMVGLEMYPASEQRFLDQWHDGLLTEEGLVRLSRWYTNWGYNWAYYRDIFLFARDAGIPMFAVNAPREVVTSVRKKGFQNLTEEESRYLPSRVDTSSEEHKTLFRAYFGDDDPLHSGMRPEDLERMYAAQATWDAAMAHNALRALRERGKGSPEAVMVVLAGGGHAAYGLGIQRQARSQGFSGKITTVAPVPVSTEDGKVVEKVQASYAELVWGVLPESAPPFPSLGLSTSAGEAGGPRKVIFLTDESPAEKAGFQVGDLLLTLDGAPLTEPEALNRAMATKRWGDSATFTVRRGERTEEVKVVLRREQAPK